MKKAFCIAIAVIYPALILDIKANCGPISDLSRIDINKTDQYGEVTLFSEMATMSFSQAQQKFGASVVYKGVPITGNYESFNAFQNAMSERSFASKIWSNKSEVIKRSGDPILVGAYRDCINRGGLSIQVENPQSNSKNVALKITYTTPRGGPSATRINNSKITSSGRVDLIDPNHCLMNGKVYEHQVSCTLSLRFYSAWEDANLSVVSDNGEDSLYFAPRLHLEAIEEDIPHDYITEPTGRSSKIEWAARGGNDTYVTFCTAPLPKGKFVLVDDEGPKLNIDVILPSPRPQQAIVNQIALLPAYQKHGLYRKICARANCGYPPGGGDIWCGGTITGSIIEWKLVPDEKIP